MPRPGMDPAHALAAPQPALIAMIAKGIFTQSLDWSMLSIGFGLGAVLIGVDLLLRRRHLALPPLGVAVGIYLPASVSVTLAVGAVLGWVLNRRLKARRSTTGGFGSADRLPEAVTEHDASIGTMVASGFIVGESLTGVALAVLSGTLGRDDTLSLARWLPAGTPVLLGVIAFCAACLWFSRKTLQK